jgi:hypothetical protein
VSIWIKRLFYVDNINCGILNKDENGNIVLKNELVYSLDNVTNK